MYATHGTQGRASLVGVVFTTQIVRAVSLERDARMATLLRAPVHQAILADIQVAGAGAAMPVVRLALREVLLEAVVVREIEQRRAEADDLLQDRPLPVVERQQAAALIVDDSGGMRE